MGTIAEKLQKTLDNKNAIKQMLIDKGKTPGDDFSGYATMIGELSNAADATIEAHDIMNGEVGYGVDGKIVGTAPFEYSSDNNYKLTKTDGLSLSADNCDVRTVSVVDNEIVLDSMFVDETTLI